MLGFCAFVWLTSSAVVFPFGFVVVLFPVVFMGTLGAAAFFATVCLTVVMVFFGFLAGCFGVVVAANAAGQSNVQFSAQVVKSTPDKKTEHAQIYVGDNQVRLEYQRD